MDEPLPAHTEKPSGQSTWRDATGGLKQNGEEKGRRERRGNKSKGEGLGWTSALGHLPSRHEVLGLRTSTGQKNKKNPGMVEPVRQSSWEAAELRRISSSRPTWAR